MKKHLMSIDPKKENLESPDQRTPNSAPSFLRMLLVLLLIGGLLVSGVYLLNALSDARKAQECLERGRRDCSTLSQ